MAQEFGGSSTSLAVVGKLEDEAVVTLMVEATHGPPQIGGMKKQPPISCHTLSPVSFSSGIHTKQGEGNTKTPQWRFREMPWWILVIVVSNLR